MIVPKGRAALDGIDLSVFGMFIEDGTDDILKFPNMKEPTTHDWKDSNGVEADLSRRYFEAKDVTLKMCAFASGFNDFWNKYNQFIAQWAKPFTHRLEISELQKSFFVYYKTCTSWKRYKRIDADTVAYKFTILLNQPDPGIDTTNVYIVDEAGSFIIT